MKSYDETVDTVLQRIHSYNVTRQRRKKAILTALPVCILCLAALTGFGLWQAGQAGGGLSPLPMTANLPKTAMDQRTIEADRIGYLICGEKYYLQEPEMSTEGLETGEHLGKASTFEGAYKDNAFGVDGEVYTIKGHDDLLGISLSDGTFIILKETSSSPAQ